MEIPADSLTRIKQKTIVQQVMEQIKDFVASGTLKPGDRLPTEIELARIFGVSRSSIREALKIFSYLGVFDSLPKRGTVLCDHSSISNEALTWTFLLGEKDFDDLIELRKAIEQEAWLTLLEMRARDREATEPAVERLRAVTLQMKKAVEDKDINALELADYSFHQTVIDATQNNQYINLFKTLKAFTLEEIRKSNIYRNFSKLIYIEHMQIQKAFEKGDAMKLLSLFRTHINKTKKNVEAAVYSKQQHSGAGSLSAISAGSLQTHQ